MIRADPVTENVPNRKQKVNEPKIYQSSIKRGLLKTMDVLDSL